MVNVNWSVLEFLPSNVLLMVGVNVPDAWYALVNVLFSTFPFL